jgi:class 3 adenylate cyclase/TolB-like protein
MSKAGETRRKLAAIVCMDLAGYSRLMKADEEGTLKRLKACRSEVIDPEIAEFSGRIVKTIGDGLLIEFPSVVDAVRCAVNIQRGMALRNAGDDEKRRMQFRIGVNLCDVIVDGDDIYGDGVNITARLEASADVGGISVTGSVYEDVVDKLEGIRFEDLQQLSFKNIDRPVRVLRLHWADDVAAEDAVADGEGDAGRPAVAVLPIAESGCGTQGRYIGEAITDDIAVALSRQPELLVIARASTAAYRGATLDLSSIARELGARFIVSGALHLQGERVSLQVRLVDARNGREAWTETLEASASVAELGTTVAARVLRVLRPAARPHAVPAPVARPELWHMLKLGWMFASSSDVGALRTAQLLAEQAMALASDDRRPLQLLAFIAYRQTLLGSGGLWENSLATACEYAERAVACDERDEHSHWLLGQVLGLGMADLDRGIACCTRAVELNDNFAEAHATLAMLLAFAGRGTEAIARNKVATRSNPNDPGVFSRNALAYYVDRVYSLAAEWAVRAVASRREWYLGHVLLIASCAELRRHDDARRAGHLFTTQFPGFRTADLGRLPFRNRDDLQRLVGGLRSAGLY